MDRGRVALKDAIDRLDWRPGMPVVVLRRDQRLVLAPPAAFGAGHRGDLVAGQLGREHADLQERIHQQLAAAGAQRHDLDYEGRLQATAELRQAFALGTIDEMLRSDAVAFVNAARRAAVRYNEAQGEKRGAADLAHQRSDGAGAAASARRATRSRSNSSTSC